MPNTSYYLYQKFEQRGDQDWLPAFPNTFSVDGDGTMPLSAKTVNDPACGYIPPSEPIYRWVNLDPSIDWVCDEAPTPVEPIYRWQNSGYTCVGYDKYQNSIKQVSYDSGTTWQNVSPAEYSATTLIEQNSEYCGYVPPISANVITYEAFAKLNETTTLSSEGLHTNAFSGASGRLTMTSHTFENGVGTIEFDGDVVSIGDQAFYGCSGLTSINIPNSVTSIGEGAFNRCSSLTSITIPSGVTSIDINTFNDCASLSSITIPDSVTSIGQQAFSGCSSLTGITIPNSVTSIGQIAFEKCYSITSIEIPNSVTSIGDYAFDFCSGLTSVTISSGITSINNGVFGNCSSLTSVTIPSGVTSIGTWAFINCSGLISITSLATTAPSISTSTFRNIKTGGTLYIKQGSTGYDTWMQNTNYYLGLYNWTKVELSNS